MIRKSLYLINRKNIYGFSVLMISLFAFAFLGLACLGDEESVVEEESDPCEFDGPSVFGRCVVSEFLCVEFHDGGVGNDTCNTVYAGTWEAGETCPASGVTGKCHVGANADNNEEWIVFYYDDNDSANQVGCSGISGEWCNF